MPAEVTNGILVEVEPEYIRTESIPEENVYVFCYHIRIQNMSDQTVQLKSRFWEITDSNGETEEVEGPGVVGKEPILRPQGEHYYSSGAVLKTPLGAMRGKYFFINRKTEEPFEATIPAFSLNADQMIH